jgi:hypothetical protein
MRTQPARRAKVDQALLNFGRDAPELADEFRAAFERWSADLDDVALRREMIEALDQLVAELRQVTPPSRSGWGFGAHPSWPTGGGRGRSRPGSWRENR